MKNRISQKMAKPTRLVMTGLANQEMNIFLVSFQLMESMPFALTENPMMELTIWATMHEDKS
jgi:hypothetical protein